MALFFANPLLKKRLNPLRRQGELIMFTAKFDKFVCEGDNITCEVDGFTCTATLYSDDCNNAPWERGDGHGPVSDWTSRGKKPGERVLNEDHGSKRYYDFQEAVRTALADGWGVEGGRKENESAKAYAARAVEADFAVLKAWCNDEWHYYGVAVTVSKAGIRLTGKYDHACWGIEGNYPGGDNSYFTEVANEELDEALETARQRVTEICTELCDCEGED
jgi:hypothetical protein